MPPVIDAAARLPSKEKLRDILKKANDPRIIDTYLQPVQRQPQGKANRLRILLQACIEAGNERLMEAVLCRNADVNASTQSSLAPLLVAARQGDVTLIKMLLHWRADIEVVDRGGKTALMYAALNGKIDAARLLLERGAQIDTLDAERRNALIYAAASDRVEVLQMLLDKGADVTAKDRHGSSAVSQAAGNGNAEALLLLLDKQADMNNVDDQKMTPVIYAASRGHTDALRTLLHYGANWGTTDAIGKTAVMHAAETNDVEILKLLFSYHALPRGLDLQERSALLTAILSEKRDLAAKLRTVQTLLDTGLDVQSNAESIKCLGSAALRGFNQILKVLIKHKANVNAVDEKGRTALLYLASDPSKQTKWNEETVKILLSAKTDIYKADQDRKRTALQWAAATGQEVLAKAVLDHVMSTDLKGYVNYSSSRSKTALHLAAQHNYPRIIRTLLNHHAQVDCRSEGGWTPFLIAAKAGHEDAVETLLAASTPADVNARTSSGMTALHWAAELGHMAVIKQILAEPDAWKNPKDSFDTTPLSRADRNGKKDIVELLKDHIFQAPTTYNAEHACNAFTASVVDFFPSGERFRSEVRRLSVKEVLYDRDTKATNKFAITTRLDEIKKGTPAFRWIHLPANNLAWAEALITKMIVEGGPIDNSGFQAMLRIFGQLQHRGTKAHSRFMRPLCQAHGRDELKPMRTPKFTLSKPPTIQSRASTSTTLEESPSLGNGRLLSTDSGTLRDSITPPPQLTASPSPSRQNSAGHVLDAPVKDIGVLFMPYLHWETDSNRLRMRNAVRDRMETPGQASVQGIGKDDCLIRGYLRHPSEPHPSELHLRRTLDQFRHHNINTDKRDRDQVVYRHHKHSSTSKHDPKIFMVDQMWVWCFENIVLTCFPERWDQPLRDPLNLFDGVIEDINSSTYPPVKSVRDLTAAITNRCTGSFDRHEWGFEDIDFMFFEIFELSIGTLTRRATALLERFEIDSTAAARWLKSRDDHQPHLPAKLATNDEDRENDEDTWLQDSDDEGPQRRPDKNPSFVNRLLNISRETKLLVECKDIEDELAILYTVLEQQRDILASMADTLRVPRKRAGLQVKMVTQHLLDINRMQRSANSVGKSLTQLLDLKQKHANAIEARFARDQAEESARTGQTVMVFTIVTIVFLPLSFMAAFFAINIVEFPHNADNGGSGLHLGWVSKYLFGIGLAVSVPMVAIAFAIADVRGWRWRLRMWFGDWRKPKRKTIGSGGTGSPLIVNSEKGPVQATARRTERQSKEQARVVITARDSEGFLYPRRQTLRRETGLTNVTADSEV